ncbi:hypothetical protein ACE5IS_09035 [Leptospira wolffii]|uniref:Uncharacterized protein n=1 Tax=Leptospira wolffii TaxID=409998 RepID=A0ABV5BR96_9LEPT|nr:hypothetical protein [Leptospira wolffii]TGL52695.1 hypothetical protein EHQ61_06440 [Leptospira wolffii]
MNLGVIQSSLPERPKDTSVQYIGHGQLESSPQSTSVLHVISHELGHVAEFRNEAIRDRAEIRSMEVSIHYEMRDGKLVAVAGETRATTVKKSEEESPKHSETSSSSHSKPENKDKSSEAKAAGRSELISDKEWELMSELREIDQELDRLDTNELSSSDPENKSEDEAHKHMKLVERKRKLELALSQEKLKALLDETLQTIQELNEKQIQFAGKVYNGEALEASGNFLESFA